MTTRVQEFDFSVNLLQALLWQYNDAANLQSLLEQKSDWYEINQKEFWENWYRDVFDLRTANNFGLAVWAIILGLPLAVDKPPSGGPAFGFGDFNQNYEHGNYQGSPSSSIVLSADQKRIVLRLRYYQLVSRGTVPEINALLNDLFGYRNVYVLDGLDMTITYVFATALDASVQQILDQYDVLPRPAGVEIKYLVVGRKVFGFGANNQNFDNGTFLE